MKEKKNIYNAADFAQYHAGTMPANEMHILEKAALEDLFLADALEGYAHTTTPEKDLEILKDKIRKQENKKNNFSLTALVNNGWLRIAAVLVIVAGTGYFFYSANDNTTPVTLAKNEDGKKKIMADTTVTLKYDTTIANNKLITTNQASTYTIKEKEFTVPKTSMPEAATATMPPQSMESPVALPSGSSNDAVSAAPVVIKRDTQALLANEFKGKIVDNKGAPVPFASIKETNTNKGTSTDADGRFYYKSKDSIVNATASAVGYESKKFNLKKEEDKGIALNKTEKELSEVVVTGYGTRKKRNISNTQTQTNANNALNGKASGVNVQNNQQANIKSVVNEEQFYLYLKNYIAPLFDEQGNKLKGEVMLEFFVNKNKRPENITVKKSTCEACEPIALQLLETGPDWIVPAGEKRLVVIKF